MSTGQDIVDEARAQLNDEDTSNFRWTDAEMLRFVNAGQRQTVTFLPEANIIEAQVTIAADSGPRQTLPADGIKFIKVANNFDTTNSVRGPALRYAEMDALDAFFPEWGYSETELPRVPNFEDQYTEVRFEHYMHDPREPKVYYLYPFPSTINTNDIMLVYSQLPADLTALGDTVVLTDEYQNAMIDYVIYRALSKDGRYGVSSDRRRELWDNYLRSLGFKVQQEVRVDPKTNSPPEGA